MPDWASAEWRAEAVAWLDDRLAAAGRERTGEVEQPHLRPWATALRAPTADGPVWLKAAGPGTAVEVRMYPLLHAAAPEHVLEPIAVDQERCWIVLPDGGPVLGERAKGDALLAALPEVFAEYGRLQRDLAPHVDELLALGVHDMRPAILPRRFDESLEKNAAWVDEHGGPGDGEQLDEVAGLRAEVVAWSEQLAAAPGGVSVDHNDLHPWNVFGGTGGEPARFFDWGDSAVAHPFASMLAALGFLASGIVETAPGDPRILGLRDAYLEVFDDVAPRAELVETVDLASRLGKIARSLTWHRIVSVLDPEDVDPRWERAPFETLAALLEPSWIGGA